MPRLYAEVVLGAICPYHVDEAFRWPCCTAPAMFSKVKCWRVWRLQVPVRCMMVVSVLFHVPKSHGSSWCLKTAPLVRQSMFLDNHGWLHSRDCMLWCCEQARPLLRYWCDCIKIIFNRNFCFYVVLIKRVWIKKRYFKLFFLDIEYLVGSTLTLQVPQSPCPFALWWAPQNIFLLDKYFLLVLYISQRKIGLHHYKMPRLIVT